MGGGFFFGHCKIPALPQAEAPTPPQMMDWLPADGENGLPEALHSSHSHALLGQAASKGSGVMSSGSAMELGEVSLRAKRGCARASPGVVISAIIRRVRLGSPHCCAAMALVSGVSRLVSPVRSRGSSHFYALCYYCSGA